MRISIRQLVFTGAVVSIGLAGVMLWYRGTVPTGSGEGKPMLAGAKTQTELPPSQERDGFRMAGASTFAEPTIQPEIADPGSGAPTPTAASGVRVVEEPGPFPFIRYEDEMGQDPVTGEPVVVRTVAMLADHVVLSVPDDVDQEAIRQSIEALGYTVARSYSFSPVWQIGLGQHGGEAVPEALASIGEALPDLLVEPDFIYRPQEISDDYDPVKLWGLKRIQAPAAWSVAKGSPEVMAAIIDSGADLMHPELKPNLWINPGEIAGNKVDDDGNGLVDDINGWDFATNDNQPYDTGRHGTHVAGTVSAAGNNGTGVVGVNWNTKLIIARVGDQSFPSSALVAAVEYVTALRKAGVNVVVSNNSYGGAGGNTAMRSAIQKARDAGIVFVAAAGNEGANTDVAGNASFPASYDVENIISVASSNLADELSIFSNYGPTTVDLAAPGSAIYSSIPISDNSYDGAYGYLSGTSMASPHVAGAVALLKSAEPDLKWNELKDRVLASVDKVEALTGWVATDGRLNLRRLLGVTTPPLVAQIASPTSSVVVLEDEDLALDLTGSIGSNTEVVSLKWASVAGPGSAVFTQPDALKTEVHFSQAGVYRLQFRAISPIETSEDEITVVVATPEVTDQGLVGFWQFEEPSGSIAQDTSDDDRDGSMNGADRTTGLVGKTARFDGEGDSVTFDSPLTDKVTISAWVRSDSLGESVFPRILETAQPADPNRNPDYIFYFGRRVADVDADINSIKFFASKSVQDGIWHTSNNTIGDGEWIHVAVSYDGSDSDNFPSIFLNGELLPVGVDARSGDQARGVVGDQIQTPGTAYIGENSEGTRAWDGLIDEVRFYTRALDRGEVAWIAAENRVRPLLDASIVVESDRSIASPFTVSADALATGGGVTWRWEVESGETAALVGGISGPEVTVIAPTGGTRRLRLSMTRAGVTVVRAVDILMPVGIRPTAGSFRGSSLGGTIWAEVDDSGLVRFLGLDESTGILLSSSLVEIAVDGRFEFEASDGILIQGQFEQDGFAGAAVDGRLTFSGQRVPSGTEGPPEVLSGPVVNTEDGQLHAWVYPDSSLFVVRAGDDLLDSGMGDVQPDGSFQLETTSGGNLTGQLDLESMVGQGTIEDGLEIASFYLAQSGGFAGERLANISTRGVVGEGDAVMIAGFVVQGAVETRTLIRGVGPTLSAFGVTDHAGSTELTLREANTVLASNRGWASSQDAGLIESASRLLGAFALESDTGDSALLADLAPGPYTVALANPENEVGLALLEVYDAGSDGTVRLVNLSTRGLADLDEHALIAGFVLDESLPRRVLVRAIGPGLETFGVSGFMADPKIRLIGDAGTLASNDDWADSGSGPLLTGLGQRVGAFELGEGSRDAALVRYLDPGRYTVQVEPSDGSSGVVLVEIYIVPEFE